MFLKTYLFITVILYPVYAYKKFYVEDYCSHGVATPQNITIGSDWNSSGILRATQSLFYSSNLNCSVDLLVPTGYGIVISLRFLELRNYHYRSDCQDYLQLISGSSTFTECGPRVDDFSESRSFMFFKNATVRFHTSSSMLGLASGFQLTFTAVRKAFGEGGCNSTEFQCRNDFCIWAGFVCDGHNNCGDKSDERSMSPSNCGYPEVRFSFRGFFLSILSIIFLSMILTYICRRYRKHTYISTVLGGTASNAFCPNSGGYGTYSYSAHPAPQQPFQPQPMPQPPQQQNFPPYMQQPPPPYTQKADARGLF